ncbi:MAG: TonB-dependent receptor, partial [Campylobacter sp.]|nr:TonB-dependent receptor [Campylobacter sp.]
VQANGYKYSQVRWNSLPSSHDPGANGNINSPIVSNNAPAGTKNGSDPYTLSNTYMKNVSVLDEIKFNEQFSLMLSFSHSWLSMKARGVQRPQDPLVKVYSKSGNSWAISPIWHPTPDSTVYFTYADSLQQGDSGTDMNGNTIYLDPYRSKQYEIGGKIRVADSLDVSSAIFRIERPVPYKRANESFSVGGKQINQGVELLAGGYIGGGLSAYGGVTYVKAKFKNPLLAIAEGKQVNGIPKWNGNLLLDYEVPGVSGLFINSNFRYTGKTYIDEANSQAMPSFFLMDLGVRYTNKNLIGKSTTVRFNVNNVFDKKYWAGMYPASVNGTGSSNSVLGAGNAGFTLGDSRIFMLSAEVKF